MNDGGINVGRRRFLTAATSVVGGAGAVGVAVPFVGSWNPSAKAKAAGAPVKYNISKLEPGQMVTVEWRGMPVYVLHRTPETLANLEKVVPLLRDPDSIESKQPTYVDPQNRAIRAQVLVLLGLCTHLQCAPTFRPEVGAADLGGDQWLGGFFCPCHGSKYDLAGRVYSGVPAPTNLPVPAHSYEGDNILVLGIDQESNA